MAAESGYTPRSMFRFRDLGAFPTYSRNPALVKRADADAFYKEKGITPNRNAHLNGNKNTPKPLTDKDIEDLGLTDEQKKKIIAINEKRKQQSNGHTEKHSPKPEPQSNGHAENLVDIIPRTGNDVDQIICQINAETDLSSAKLQKEKAQALKIALEVRKRQKEDGELITVDQLKQILSKLAIQIRNSYMSIGDGFLSEIDGLPSTQVNEILELRLEAFGKRLTEIDFEDLNLV